MQECIIRASLLLKIDQSVKRTIPMNVFYITAENVIVSDLLNVKRSRGDVLGIKECLTIRCIVDESYNGEVSEALWVLHSSAYEKTKNELEQDLATSRNLGHQEDIEACLNELQYLENFENYPGVDNLSEVGEASATFESNLVDLFNTWLEEKFVGAGNYHSYHTAFQFFEQMGRSVTQELGIEIIEGRHPGDDTQVAELKVSVDEANMRAREHGIGIVFEPHPKQAENVDK